MLFKPDIDDRYGKDRVVTHDQVVQEAVVVPTNDSKRISELTADDVKVVGIDEAQFFDPTIVSVCQELLSREIDVIVAGLKQDSNGELFGSMDWFLIHANFITNLTAVCGECGEEATMTQWLGSGQTKDTQVVVGGSEQYAAVCHKRHTKA
jgi:thymidine kinase